jgi:carboxypeptidase Q
VFRKLIAPLLLVGLVTTASAQQTEKIDAAMNAKIRTEGMEHSKIMWIEHFLTDVYGPRPIGSPNHVAAANWAVKTMQSWGMQNVHLEPFTWRGVGWLPGRAVGYVTAPVKFNIKFESNPWSPSTKGTVRGEVVNVMAPENPTEAELEAYLETMAPKVKNAIVMVGKPAVVPVSFNDRPKRTPDSAAKAQFQGGGGGRGGRGNGRGGPAAILATLTLGPTATRTDSARVMKSIDSLKAAGVLTSASTIGNLVPVEVFAGRGGRGGGAPAVEGRLSAAEVNQRITTMLRDNMPALRLNSQGGGRIPGEIVAQNGAGQIYDNVTPQPPTVILRNDDAGRIWRIIQDGTPVTVELNMENTFYPEGKTSYVTVGEIPGTDKADEVVMMGGHLDSWTSATGATDNAIGCAIMMEAARILETLGVKPRRTIRVALWSGEEEGEYGSTAYVKNHFGTAEDPKPEFNKLQAYWNIDDGTGLVRGASVFGPPDAAAAVAQIFKPFEDFKIYGANPTTARVSASSDHGPFVVAGLPGIGASQDNIEYNTTTWHSNLDTYERIIPDDVMKNATISASLMYHLANRDQLLPRFTKETMPPVPAGRGGGGGGRGGAGAGVTAAPHVFAATKSVMLKGFLVGTGAPPAPPADGATPAPVSTVTLGTKPAHGVLLLKADGTFSYTPRAGFVGSDSFTYKVSRGGETSAEAKVTILVR